ncbi:MFS transporter [Streptosporangium sandarakinum]|uniref:MFS transporter n=1 Tax=Streptosporangium sandarakinum TaxID=1260955 RepID=UPI003686E259
MITTLPRASDARVRRLAATLYAYTFLDDFTLLYPLYALLFADTGLSTAEISSLLAIWSLTSLVMEIPSGAWADTVSRRLLLVLAPLLAGAGYALWFLFPSYGAFAAGFVLWGTAGALQSGALEALVYTELEREDAVGRYAGIMGRARALGTGAVMAATALAVPLFAAGGYSLVGVASVLVCLVCAAVAAAFPEHRTHRSHRGTGGRDGDPVPDARDGDPAPDTRDRASGPDAPDALDVPDRDRAPGSDARDRDGGPGGDAEDRDDGTGEEAEPSSPRAYLGMLRAGLREARGDRAVRRALLLVPAVAALWGALEEYVPLLAAGTGVATETVPLLVLLVSAGVAAGGFLAAAGSRLTGRGLAVLLAVGAVALGAGAAAGNALGFFAIAAAFCVFQTATVLADVRLQNTIAGPARATVTSVAGLATDVASLGVYGGYAAASAVAGHGMIFTLSAVPYLLIALFLASRRDSGRSRRDPGRSRWNSGRSRRDPG